MKVNIYGVVNPDILKKRNLEIINQDLRARYGHFEPLQKIPNSRYRDRRETARRNPSKSKQRIEEILKLAESGEVKFRSVQEIAIRAGCDKNWFTNNPDWNERARVLVEPRFGLHAQAQNLENAEKLLIELEAGIKIIATVAEFGALIGVNKTWIYKYPDLLDRAVKVSTKYKKKNK